MSVTAPAGFHANGLPSGIKPSGQLDLALVAAATPVPTAAVFTGSLTEAPPVTLSRKRAQSGRVQAVVINSGCANAGTGSRGMAAAEATTGAVADGLGCASDHVLVCSTGPIGTHLPIAQVVPLIPGLVSGLGATPDHGFAAAKAILTTDSRAKETVVAGDGYLVGGMAKGAGMVRPDMATMLAVLTTDAVADPKDLQDVLNEAVAATFNCLNIDGCQSTNDTAVLMASAESGSRPKDTELFDAVLEVCRRLALDMAEDAEGATKVVRLVVTGAVDDTVARRLGMAVADSALVRSAFYGADPNWGRVFGALGVAGVDLDPTAIDISFAGVPTCRQGVAVPFDEDATAALLESDFTVDISVGDGMGKATVVTTDLTPEYVRFNAERS